MKNGVFYTISGFFLVSLVFILSILLAATINQSNQRLYESGGFERVIALDTSLEHVLASLNNTLTISLNDIISSDEYFTTLSIIDTPNNNFTAYGSSFYNNISALKDYVETDQPEISFDLTKVYNATNKVTLAIKPIGMAYTHTNISNRPIITIIPRYIAYEGQYSGSGTPLDNAKISIKLNDVTLSGSNKVTWVTQNSGTDLNLTLILKDKLNYTEEHNYTLNINSPNTFRINGVNNVTVNVSSLCVSCIQIDRGNLNITSNFSTNIENTGDTVTVNYPPSFYTINFSDLDIFVNKTPRIL